MCQWGSMISGWVQARGRGEGESLTIRAGEGLAGICHGWLVGVPLAGWPGGGKACGVNTNRACN